MTEPVGIWLTIDRYIWIYLSDFVYLPVWLLVTLKLNLNGTEVAIILGKESLITLDYRLQKHHFPR